MAVAPIAECSNPTAGLFPPPKHAIKKSTEGWQRCKSDVSINIRKNQPELNLSPISEVENAECECCGMSEEYTAEYVGKVRDCHHGKWVCGLCSADVKEQLKKIGKGDMEEALRSHMAECKKFNGTMRVNPKLCIAGAMRDIVRRCRDGSGCGCGRAKEERNSGRIGRTSSCVSRINMERDRLQI